MARTPKIPGEPTPEPEAAKPEPVQDLPQYFEVDPLAINEPTLTRQGWVVPAPKEGRRV